MAGSDFSYFAYDFLTGRPLGQLPFRGVSFGQQLDTAGQMSATLDLDDPRIGATDPLNGTAPNRTFIVVDYLGAIVWGGVVLTRKRSVDSSLSSTTRALDIQCSELWAWMSSRIQATDYSAPPFSGITGSSRMAYWDAGPIGGPWDATLIAAQVISDALTHSVSLPITNGNPLNGLGLLVNGAAPSASAPVMTPLDYVDVNYPFTSTQTIGTIVSQLAQLGLGVGFDFGVDLAYSAGPGSAPVATINISYPVRGRTFAQSQLVLDVTTARRYEFPEDGTQTANQAYEVGGAGAIVVDKAQAPENQGYALWERVFSRANIQSASIQNLLGQIGRSDLALNAYAPVTPTATLSVADPNLPLGSYIVGDNVEVRIPQYAEGLDANGDLALYDPRFPAGLTQEWRIVQWQATVADAGDSTVQYTFNQPPFAEPLAPAI